METTKTTLQIIKEELEGKMKRAIEQAIEAGAEIKKVVGGGAYVDGIYITPRVASSARGLVLDIECDELEEALAPTRTDLAERAEQLRAELEQIEKQLNEAKQ